MLTSNDTHNITNTKLQWITNQKTKYPNADDIVLKFIADILYHSDKIGAESIRNLFRNGYCYYFAHMLKSAFGRGTVCYAYFKGHFVWLDGTSETKHVAYDIEGVNKDWEHLIPENKLGDGIWDFKHVNGKQSNMEDNQIASLLLTILENEEYAK